MAGSCYINVESADAAYSAEIGFYHKSDWKSVAASETISTPPERIAETSESEFATVPLHLSFQRMIETLRSSRGDDLPLIAKLADLRERSREPESAPLNESERELADALDAAEASLPQPSVAQSDARDPWTRQRLERILGFGATSPTGGFGGSSRSV